MIWLNSSQFPLAEASFGLLSANIMSSWRAASRTIQVIFFPASVTLQLPMLDGDAGGGLGLGVGFGGAVVRFQ